ncbi:MAG: YaiI/YqxD family protein [Spirochaetaceae bacterium]|nr:YaiI/YqxD family protein [Spirochaetaceae bacterium]MDT8299800.1 YaiI/YqxD family protein [Spirochaetaceae bacterium]
MRIWVDADACPTVIRDILFRASKRTGIPLILVANTPLRVPDTPLVEFIHVKDGFDVADAEIVKRVQAGDLVITADIPLAAQVVEKDCVALDFRGTLTNSENVGDRLATRNLMDTLRGAGLDTGGPPPLGPKDRQVFAGKLDSFLTRNRSSL